MHIDKKRCGLVGPTWPAYIRKKGFRIRMDPQFFLLDQDPHESQKLLRLKIEPWRAWTLKMEAWRLKMEPWRVCRPFVADSHSPRTSLLNEKEAKFVSSYKLDSIP
jgi:hypothetical protein